MFRYFTIILLSLKLFSHTLEPSYSSKNGLFYSDDLLPHINKHFEILKIPPQKDHIRVNAKTISKIFEINNIIVEPTTNYIDFYKNNTDSYNKIKDLLKEKLTSRYHSIDIESISINTKTDSVAMDKNSQIIFSDNIYLSPRGTFYIIEPNGVRRYFEYFIKATINTLQTTRKIERKEPLSLSNTTITKVIYTATKEPYLDSFPSQNSRFKVSLKPEQIITQKYLEPIPLVLKDSKVTAIIRDDGVIAEFSAIATQEGSLYDIITIQKNDKKRLKAKVIGENMVELE